MNSDMDGKILVGCRMWISKFFALLSPHIFYLIKVSNECQIEIKMKLTADNKWNKESFFFKCKLKSIIIENVYSSRGITL